MIPINLHIDDICTKINDVEALLDEQINKTAQLQIENLAVEKHKELATYKVQREKELQVYEDELSAKKQKLVADRRYVPALKYYKSTLSNSNLQAKS